MLSSKQKTNLLTYCESAVSLQLIYSQYIRLCSVTESTPLAGYKIVDHNVYDQPMKRQLKGVLFYCSCSDVTYCCESGATIFVTCPTMTWDVQLGCCYSMLLFEWSVLGPTGRLPHAGQ